MKYLVLLIVLLASTICCAEEVRIGRGSDLILSAGRTPEELYAMNDYNYWRTKEFDESHRRYAGKLWLEKNRIDKGQGQVVAK